MALLEEKVKLFRDMCDSTATEEPSLVSRTLFRASAEDMPKGEPVMKDALKEGGWKRRCSSANKCIKLCRCGQEVKLLFRPNVRMGKKCDQSDFDRGMTVGARQGGLSIPETVDLLSCSSAGKNTLWPDCLNLTGR